MAHMTCQGCRKPLPEATARRRFCDAVCRAIAWRKRRARGQADRDARLRLLLAEALRELGKEEA